MIRKTLIAAILAVLSASAVAAVSPEEAAQLGKNADPDRRGEGRQQGRHDPGVDRWPDDAAGRLQARRSACARTRTRATSRGCVITGQNADQYKDQLTAITYALLKRYPTMRVDVYPTHRPVTFPEEAATRTRSRMRSQAKTVEGGLGFENALPGTRSRSRRRATR